MREDTLPIVERLRSRAYEHRHHRKYREQAADAIEALVEALEKHACECEPGRECLALKCDYRNTRATLEKVRVMR